MITDLPVEWTLAPFDQILSPWVEKPPFDKWRCATRDGEVIALLKETEGGGEVVPTIAV